MGSMPKTSSQILELLFQQIAGATIVCGFAVLHQVLGGRHLAVGVQQGLKEHEGGRHHIFR